MPQLRLEMPPHIHQILNEWLPKLKMSSPVGKRKTTTLKILAMSLGDQVDTFFWGPFRGVTNGGSGVSIRRGQDP